VGKGFNALHAVWNKIINWFWTRDPIAVMQLEYDKAVAQLKEGREGLEQYRGLVERVSRQVQQGEKNVTDLTARIKAYLKAGDRKTAGQLALQLQVAEKELAENREQLVMHETAYANNVEKIKHAGGQLAKVREKIQKYEAELKMSQAEAELARLSQTFKFDVTTDFGEIEQIGGIRAVEFWGAVDGHGAVEKWKTCGVVERLMGLSEGFFDRETDRRRVLGDPGQTCA